MASYEQIGKKKLWSVRFRETGLDGLEHNRRLTGYETRRDAEAAYADYMHNNKARMLKDGRTVIDNVIRRYLDELRQTAKPSTVVTVEQRIGAYILPYFSGVAIGRISAEDVIAWRQRLIDKGLSFRTVQSANSRLGSLMRYAEQRDNIPSVMNKVRPLRNTAPREEMRIWTPEQFAAVMEQVTDPAYRLLYRFLFSTGCRRGEALALQCKDFSQSKNYIKIYKSITTKGKTNGEVSITTPKNNASYREIVVQPSLLAEIRDYIRGRAHNSFVFSKTGDKPFPYTTIDRNLRSAASAAGEEEIRIHDLRHSHASYLISAGVSIVAVAKRLGHSDITQTLNTYSHCLPKDDDQISALIASV